jgi:outer membrane protein OmpA-like peptidoglycan-associated protein
MTFDLQPRIVRPLVRTGPFVAGLGLALAASACARSAATNAGKPVEPPAPSTARAAILDAAVGGEAGASISAQMDRQARELRRIMRGATVERIGQGILVTLASGLVYDFNHQVRAEGAERLRDLAASVARFPRTDLLIVCHTPPGAQAVYDQHLVESCALAASDYLATLGVNASRLHTAEPGAGEPKVTGGSDAGELLNLRIEVAIVASAAARKTDGS